MAAHSHANVGCFGLIRLPDIDVRPFEMLATEKIALSKWSSGRPLSTPALCCFLLAQRHVAVFVPPAIFALTTLVFSPAAKGVQRSVDVLDLEAEQSAPLFGRRRHALNGALERTPKRGAADADLVQHTL